MTFVQETELLHGKPGVQVVVSGPKLALLLLADWVMVHWPELKHVPKLLASCWAFGLPACFVLWVIVKTSSPLVSCTEQHRGSIVCV